MKARTSIIAGLSALALAAGAGAASASPVRQARPAPSCSFRYGKTTCVTTSKSSRTYYVPATNGFVRASTLFDGVTGAQICTFSVHGSKPVQWAGIAIGAPGDLTITTVATVKTVRAGLRGRVVAMSATRSVAITAFTSHAFGCEHPPPHPRRHKTPAPPVSPMPASAVVMPGNAGRHF